MATEEIFVGRKAELEQFEEVLKDPQGQAVLVVGKKGVGKTMLINKIMTEAADGGYKRLKLKCGAVRYEVTPTDSVDSIMTLMMDNAFEATSTEPGSLDKVPQRRKQWMALLNVVNLGDLVMSLQRDPQRNTREQFLERLQLISKRMPKNGRAIFIIDPEKYMQDKSDYSWGVVVRNLPHKIKFVFAQRTDDVLEKGEVFRELANVVRIPERELEHFDKKTVAELVRTRTAATRYSASEVEAEMATYDGYPYSVGAVLNLIEYRDVNVGELRRYTTYKRVTEKLWEEVCKSGDDARKLFEAYAVLEVGVPDAVIEPVSGVDGDTREHLLADKYLGGLLRKEGEGVRIYHAILADYILGQMSKKERGEYHGRAVEVYREKLAVARERQTRPDALAAMRLAEHVLAAEGKGAFVDAFVDECFGALSNLGLLDAAIGLSERALEMVKKGTEEEAMLLCNSGLIYRTRGQLDEAEEMHKKSLAIEEKLGLLEGMASDYGNLGLIYKTRGQLDKAEEMFEKILKIHKQLGSKEGMAKDYGNLGLIYGTRGELDKAEEMFEKILKIHKQLGSKEGMASDYGNLGLIYRKRGRLDEAEEMHKKSLTIAEELGRLEGMANQYGNLGLIYRERGQLDEAEEMHKKSLAIEKKLGRLEGMASDYGNLGLIYETRGELDEAEEMHKKSLAIEKKLGRLEGMASDYGNLGVVYKGRGDDKKTREYWEKAAALYGKIGMPHMVERVQGWIEELGDEG